MARLEVRSELQKPKDGLPQTWEDWYTRVGKEWAVLSARARRWVGGLGHDVRSFRPTSPYNRVSDGRDGRCKRCRLSGRLTLAGELMGLGHECRGRQWRLW